MNRSLPAIVAAALLASMAVGAVSQAPTPQPGNAAPTISLSTQPPQQSFGVRERFIVAAAATDDTDPKERLTYRWTVRNLATGVEQGARSTTLRHVRTSGRAPGDYEYKCIVTDASGAAAEATLTVSIQDTGAPEVAGLAFDDNTGAFHRVTPFWREGLPAIRRGEWAVMLVSVRNFIGASHVLNVFVDAKPVATGGAGSSWAVQNLGGTTTERRVRLFVPPDVAVEKHSIEVAVLKRGADGAPDIEMSRASFSPLVLAREDLPPEPPQKAPASGEYRGRLFVAGEPALGVAPGATVTLTAHVLLDAGQGATSVEAQLAPVEDNAISILGDARAVTSALAPDVQWTSSWQVRVNAPGTYRLPVRVRAVGLSEAAGEILLVAGASDPDADMADDFAGDARPSGWSVKAMAGAAALVAALLFGGTYLVRRRRVATWN